MEPSRITDVGDTAFNVEFGEALDPAANARVMGLHRAIVRARAQGRLAGVTGTIPTFRSLMVRYDPLLIRRTEIEAEILALARETREAEAGDGRCWTIPVCYDPDLGEDLEELASLGGLSRDDAIRAHAGAEYRVHMLGFMPGFAYMGGLADALRQPRRASPRIKVPAGSVAVAEAMCAVYPWESPGGWHLIGRTPVRFFDLERDPPSLLAAGDRVRFRPVDREAYEQALRDPVLMAPDRLLTEDA